MADTVISHIRHPIVSVAAYATKLIEPQKRAPITELNPSTTQAAQPGSTFGLRASPTVFTSVQAWIPGLTPEPTLVSDAAVDAVAGWKDWMPASIPGSLAIGVGGSALAVGTVAYMLHHRSSNKKVLAVMRRELVEAVSENARMREELQGVFKHVAEELHRNKKFLPAADAEDVLLLTITSTEDLKTQFGSLLAYIVRLSISNSEATEKCQQLQKNAVTLRTEIKNTKEQLETAKSELVDERKDKQQLGLKVQKLQFDNRSVKEQLHTIQADLETNTADFEIERSGLRDQLEDTKGDLKNSAQQEEYLRTKLTRLEETAQRREEAHNAEVQTLMASSEADKAEIQSLKEQLKEKGDELADVRDANVRLEVEKTELEEKVASMALEPSQERIQRLKKDKEDLEEKVNVLSSAKADLESELSKSEEAMKGLEASVQDLTSVKDSLESSISTSEKDKKDLQEEVAGLALANASLKSTNTIFESSLTESETHSKELQKQVQSIKATNEVLKRSVEQAKKTNMKLENKVQGLTTENTDLKSQNACLGTQVTGLTDSLQAAEKSNEDLETEVSGLKMDKVNSGMAAEQSQRLIGGLQKQNGALHEQVTDLESRNKAGEDSLKQMKHLETSNQELTSKVQYFMTARNTQEASNRQLKTENEALKGHQATLQETVRSLRSENNASQKRQLEAESLTPNKGTDFGNARYHDLPMRTSLSTGKLQFQNSKLQQQLEEARAATSTQQPEPAFVWPLGSGDAGLFQTRPELGMDTADKPKVALPPKSGPVDDPNSTEELDQTKDTADKPKVALPPKSGRVYDANSTEEQNQVEDGEDGSSVGDPEAPPTVRKKRRQQRSVQNAKTRMARLREKTEMICDNKIRFEHIDFEALAAKCTGFPKEQLDEAVEEAINIAVDELKGTGVVIHRVGQDVMEKAIQRVREKAEAKTAAAKLAASQAYNGGTPAAGCASTTPKGRPQNTKTMTFAQRLNLLKAHKATTIARADGIDWQWLASKVNTFDGTTIAEAIENADVRAKKCKRSQISHDDIEIAIINIKRAGSGMKPFPDPESAT